VTKKPTAQSTARVAVMRAGFRTAAPAMWRTRGLQHRGAQMASTMISQIAWIAATSPRQRPTQRLGLLRT